MTETSTPQTTIEKQISTKGETHEKQNLRQKYIRLKSRARKAKGDGGGTRRPPYRPMIMMMIDGLLQPSAGKNRTPRPEGSFSLIALALNKLRLEELNLLN